jgi:hypothetical protein
VSGVWIAAGPGQGLGTSSCLVKMQSSMQEVRAAPLGQALSSAMSWHRLLLPGVSRVSTTAVQMTAMTHSSTGSTVLASARQSQHAVPLSVSLSVSALTHR